MFWTFRIDISSHALYNHNQPMISIKNKKIYLIIVIILISIHYLIIISSSWNKAAIYDEAVNITSGYAHLRKGNFEINKEHLTFWKEFITIPLLFLEPTLPTNLDEQQYIVADKFLYNNNLSADSILRASRIMNALGVFFLGLIIFKWSLELWGVTSAFFSLFFFLLCPNIIGWAGFSNTDFGLTVMIFLTTHCFYLHLKNPDKSNLILTGILFGLTQATKVTAILLYPTFLFLGIFYYLLINEKYSITKILLSISIIFLIGFCITSLTYMFSGIHNYFKGIRQVLDVQNIGGDVFVNGTIFPKGNKYYFIYSFLIKNSIPFIVLFLLSIIKSIFTKKSKEDIFKLVSLITIPVSLFIIASLSKRQLGLRYILPIYPFLFIFLGSLFNNINRKTIYFLIPLIVWMIFNNLSVHPNYLTFFNEFAGGSKNGYKHLVYDLDYGQDIKNIKKYLNPQNELILAYFGNVKPEYYQIDYQYGLLVSEIPDTMRLKKINSLNPKRELLAVSSLIYQMARIKDEFIFDWLKTYKPIDIVGNTILLYDITKDANAHINLAYIYMQLGKLDLAERELKRSLIIDSNRIDAIKGLEKIREFKNSSKKL
ncbi:MAG TPA: hypothetical protein DCP53_03690 [Elusimicrobia bacterium]|nr:MAG: hypothetical protein A2551_03110 [Elusimicrobia bacterium RIFOXYD2_FULL_34_30]HAM38482.1 hypothetical protein [Elusimicrobiota bacterium]